MEDEASLSDPLSYMLRNEAFEVEIAGTGLEALESFDQRGADLVLLDLMSPGLSDTEVCRALRTHSSVAVTILTAKGDTRRPRQAPARED